MSIYLKYIVKFFKMIENLFNYICSSVNYYKDILLNECKFGMIVAFLNEILLL